MKFFAINSEGDIVTLVFGNEDKAEEAFNSNSEIIVDSTGKSYNIDVNYGYSCNISDFSKVVGRNIQKINPILEKDMQGDM